MKDFLIFIPATLVYLAVKSTILASFPVPDLPLIMVFYLGYTRPSLEGALLCFVVGYIEDALAGGVTGSTSFALIFIFLSAYFLSRKVQFTSALIKGLAAFFLTLLKGALVYAVLSPSSIGLSFRGFALLQALFTGLAAPYAIHLLSRLKFLTGPRAFAG